MSLTTFAISANAQTKTPDHQWKHDGQQKGEHHDGDHRGGHHKGMMFQKLNLSDAQKDQMKNLNNDFKTKMEALKKNDQMTMGDFKTQREALAKEHKSQMLAILTPDQKNQLEQLKKDEKANREQKGEKRFEKMQSELSLTPDQVSKLKSNHENLKSQMDAIKNNSSLSEEQKHEQMKALHQQSKDYMKSILTADQLKKLEERKHRKMKTT